MKPTSRKAVYPGTFDPITRGHLDIILRSAAFVDELIIAVASDVLKEPLFTLEQRVDMVRNDVQTLSSSAANKIEVLGFKGLLVDFAKSKGATLIIRGLRAISDFEYEFQLSAANHTLDNSIETVFLPAKDSTHFISATVVKEIARLKGKTAHFVSPYIEGKLVEKFHNK
jgi:pantetheine-phosphate adenylyltransferase